MKYYYPGRARKNQSLANKLPIKESTPGKLKLLMYASVTHQQNMPKQLVFPKEPKLLQKRR